VTAALILFALRFGPHDVASVFFISKSENKNQVHYGLHLDSQCAPDGAQPVYAYWQMREGATPHVEGLLAREESAYGIASQVVTGTTIRLVLRALPDRPILVHVARTDAGCVATPTTMIARSVATLDHVFVQIAWPFGVSYLELFGKGAGIEERLSR
jgi:hypothetical protein